MRADSERNRQQLIDAAGEVFMVAHGPASLSTIAKHAGLAPATAYRHFASLDDLLATYLRRVVESLNEYASGLDLSGSELLDAICRRWIDLVLVHGPAMVRMRRREGYLQRLHGGTDYVVIQRQTFDRPIRETLAEWDLPDLGERGLLLWNALFDPREILDLLNTTGMSKFEIGDHMIAAFKAALHGWSTAPTSNRRTRSR